MLRSEGELGVIGIVRFSMSRSPVTTACQREAFLFLQLLDLGIGLYGGFGRVVCSIMTVHRCSGTPESGSFFSQCEIET
jgi:hypothetical protein